MRLTDENKKKISDEIQRGAAQLFRENGYDAVNLDAIMAAAGLTRGAFYAHFRTKSDLFVQVMRHEHPLLRLLRDRTGEDPVTLRSQMQAIFSGYLAPAHLSEVFTGCSLAALTGDTTRADADVRAAYQAAWQDIVTEMGRGYPKADRAPLHAALLLATGAVRSATAMQAADARSEVLNAAHATVLSLFDTAFGVSPD